MLIQQGRDDETLPSTIQTWTVGRTVHFENRQWHEISDTRIPAGQKLSDAYSQHRHKQAEWIEVELWFFPDWHYQGLFRRLVEGGFKKGNSDINSALSIAEKSGFLVDRVRQELKSVTGASPGSMP